MEMNERTWSEGRRWFVFLPPFFFLCIAASMSCTLEPCVSCMFLFLKHQTRKYVEGMTRVKFPGPNKALTTHSFLLNV